MSTTDSDHESAKPERRLPLLRFQSKHQTSKNEELFQVTRDGDYKAVRFAIKEGADPDCFNEYEETPLFVAIEGKHWGIVKYLLTVVKDLNSENGADGFLTPLSRLVKMDELEMVQVCIDAGAEVDYANYDGETALMYAKSLKMVKLLIKNGASIDTVDTSDLSGRTVIHHFIYNHGDAMLDSVKYLVSKGAAVNTIDNNQNTEIMTAAYRPAPKTVEYLIELGVELNYYDGFESTAFTFAVGNGDFLSARRLFDAGAETNIDGEYGNIALRNAVMDGKMDRVKFLVSLGMKMNQSIGGKSQSFPILIATGNSHPDLVEYLISLKVDLEVTDMEGNTPLLLAINRLPKFTKATEIRTLKLLLTKGVKFSAKNKRGERAMDIAKRRRNEVFIKMLEEAGYE
jgi:ankyrin repeat protein